MSWNRTTRKNIEARIEKAKEYGQTATAPIQKEKAALFIKAANAFLAGWDAAQEIKETDSTAEKIKKTYILTGSILGAAELAIEQGIAEGNKAEVKRIVERTIDKELCGNDDIDNAASIMREERNAHISIWDARLDASGWAK